MNIYLDWLKKRKKVLEKDRENDLESIRYHTECLKLKEEHKATVESRLNQVIRLLRLEREYYGIDA